MKEPSKFAFLFAIGLALAASAAPLCFSAVAAFSRRGDFAEVTIVGKTLDLEITRADGTRESGRATIRTDQYGVNCWVFFAGDGSQVAVVTRLPLQDPESVRVWDLATAKWRSSFDFAPRPGLEGGITVLGFWKGGPDLAIKGAWLVDATNSEVALALVDISGNVVAGPKPYHYPLVDVGQGRAWVSPLGPPSGCFYSAATFDGRPSPEQPAGSPKVPCACFGKFDGFPSADLIVAAVDLNSFRGTVVSSCNVATNEHKQVLIPAPRKQFLDLRVDAGPASLEVSPNGKFFAVDVGVTRWSPFDTQRAEWDDLYVFQTAPFQRIGKVSAPKGCRDKDLFAFAVGDTADKPQVAVNWCGKWTVQTVSSDAPASHH